jgi:hypothetical protein
MDGHTGWLLLADNYINSAKYEQAGDLLNVVLQYNAVGARALNTHTRCSRASKRTNISAT